MREKIFLAGATGAIGSALIPLLRDTGHAVWGTTRHAGRADALARTGATPVVVDVFDADALAEAMARIAPTAVIHQLTDLPRGLDPARMAEATVRNARIRAEGTRNLVAAALAAGAKKLVAQSIAWCYAPGAEPFTEDRPLDMDPHHPRRVSIDGVLALEQAVLGARGLTGTVLRYGHLYGPGTGTQEPATPTPVHVETAAWAAVLAMERGQGGVFNIVEDNPHIANDKARRVLAWRPDFRRAPGAGIVSAM